MGAEFEFSYWNY